MKPLQITQDAPQIPIQPKNEAPVDNPGRTSKIPDLPKADSIIIYILSIPRR